MTLRALGAIRRRGYQLALFTAWHAAAFERIDRLPELAPLLERLDGCADEDQDPDEQIAAARSIVAAFGGRER
ncbi:MAG: hypothetical protein K8T90_08910 [Planctomycetes bacterium]|nr:hypothetical protein [Planctomycetota bacterium]